MRRRSRAGAHRLVPGVVPPPPTAHGRHRLVAGRRARTRARSLVLAVGATATVVGVVLAGLGAGAGGPSTAVTAREFDEPPPADEPESAATGSSPRGSTLERSSPVSGREARPAEARSRVDPALRGGREDQQVPERAEGTFSSVPLDGPVDTGATTYVVQVEDGLALPSRAFGAAVARTLGDPRSWAGGDLSVLSPASDLASADFRVVLASPETTDALCAPLLTRGRVSCRNGGDVVINAWRWVNGADGYGDDLTSYRQYLVNHEVGHALGHGHAGCPAPGAPAPVMLQQTLGLQGCAPNPWPATADLQGH